MLVPKTKYWESISGSHVDDMELFISIRIAQHLPKRITIRRSS